MLVVNMSIYRILSFVKHFMYIIYIKKIFPCRKLSVLFHAFVVGNTES